MKQLGLMRAQADLDLAQAFASGELREGHAQELIEAGELLDVAMAVVAINATSKGGLRQMLHELREDVAIPVHGGFPVESAQIRATEVEIGTSPKTPIRAFQSTTCAQQSVLSPDSTGLCKDKSARESTPRRWRRCCAPIPCDARSQGGR